MPNTLAHLGLGIAASRVLGREVDPRWVLTGCLIPDAPWIAARAVPVLVPGVDPFELRLYAVAQSSLAISLLLCGALASLTRAPRRVFALLSLMSLVHLLLDACQTKWGNGVHLLAPFSWELLNWELFWPESGVTWALAALGGGATGWVLWRIWSGAAPQVGWGPPAAAPVAIGAALLAAYAVAPLLLRGGPYAADNHSVRTLMERETRPGRPVAFDRGHLVAEPAATLRNFDGELLHLVGSLPEPPAQVSVRGRFRERAVVVVEALHVHRGWPRDAASYLGLGLVAFSWLMPRRAAA